MARKSSRRAAAPPIVLSEALDLPAAAPLQAALLAQRGRDVAIDASAARRMGGQCLQVLLAARATWADDKRAFRVVAASSDFIEAIALLGAPDLVPADLVPADHAPADQAPPDQAPADRAPVDQASVEPTLATPVSAEAAPAEPGPSESSPDLLAVPLASAELAPALDA